MDASLLNLPKREKCRISSSNLSATSINLTLKKPQPNPVPTSQPSLFSLLWSNSSTCLPSRYVPEVQIMSEDESDGEEDCESKLGCKEETTARRTSTSHGDSYPHSPCDLLQLKSETHVNETKFGSSTDLSLFPICVTERSSQQQSCSLAIKSKPRPFSLPRINCSLESHTMHESTCFEDQVLSSPLRLKASPKGSKATLVPSPKRISSYSPSFSP